MATGQHAGFLEVFNDGLQSQPSSISASGESKATARPIGRKSELSLRENDKYRKQDAKGAEKIAHSHARRFQLMEERIGLAAFSAEE